MSPPRATPSSRGAAYSVVMSGAASRWPLRIWALATGGVLVLFVGPLRFFGDPHMSTASVLILLLAPAVALYSATRANRVHGRLALAGSLIMVPLTLVSSWVVADALRTALLAAGMFVTAWALGETGRTRGESAEVRAAERAEHDRAVAAEERARIARELHDITAHHISVVTLQAGAARLLAESGQAPSAELLGGIENAGRQAMIEIRQALGVIRSTPDGATPAPDLARLPELVRRMAQAGLTVRIDGYAGTVPGGIGLTAYRIVQEGLTNIARHSAADTALVTFRRGAGTLAITVVDDGPRRADRPVGPGGHGLIGLRERVTPYGGELRAGPTPRGGFELCATLPMATP